MASADKAIAIVGVVMILATACGIVAVETIRGMTDREAIKAVLQQDGKGHWVKAELNKERGDDAR